MPKLEVDDLLKPLSPEQPCGPDPRSGALYAVFNEIRRLADESASVGSDMVSGAAAKAISWREVFDKCVELTVQSRHLEIIVILVKASTCLDGYKGVEASLRLLSGYLTQHWATVYPILDPEDNDPTERINIVQGLSTAPATFGDPLRYLEALQKATVVEGPNVGRFSLRDYALAAGQIKPADNEAAPSMALIEGAFAKEAPTEQLEATAKTIEACLAHIDAIVKAFADQAKGAETPDLDKLSEQLKLALRHVKDGLSKRGIGAPPGEEAAAADGSAGAGGTPAFRSGGRVDVHAQLEAVIEHYRQHEPSSPVAIVVMCAQKLVGKDFLTISDMLSPEEVRLLKKIRDWSGESPSEPTAP